MIGKIARKEFLFNLLTIRFVAGTVLLVVLTALFSSILIRDYKNELREFDKFVAKNNAELRQVLTYQNLTPTIYKPPEILTLFSKGVEENVAKSATINIQEIPSLTSSSLSKSPLLSVFPVFDVVLVFKLVTSVLAFLLAYDAISGEKEEGTLRLMLSNNIPRAQIVFGKFLGGMLTLAIPIALGFLITILMIVLSPMITLTGGEWLRLGLMLAVSLIMVAVFLNIGLFVSSLTKRASDTLMVLLFVWVVFLFIIPNASSYLAVKLKPSELAGKINTQVRQMRARMNSQIRMIFRQLPDLGGYSVESDAHETWGGYVKFCSAAFVRERFFITERALPITLKTVREIDELNQKYINEMVVQRRWADSLSRLSPISLYENLLSSLSRTDAASLQAFSGQARSYREQVVNYLERKKALASTRWFTPLAEDKIFDVQNTEEYMAFYKKYADYQPIPLDITDFPSFSFRQVAVMDSLKQSLPDLLILVFMGLFFFACAFVAVLKYDVR